MTLFVVARKRMKKENIILNLREDGKEREKNKKGVFWFRGRER